MQTWQESPDEGKNYAGRQVLDLSIPLKYYKMKQVLVFKTSANSSQVRTVEPLLKKLLSKTEKWNFDLEDCDRILRVEAVTVNADSIMDKLRSAGVLCDELED